jgi:beta-lactamase class A
MSDTIPAGEVKVERSLYEMTLGLRNKHELEELGISYYDYHTTIQWAFDGDRWFHAASTMKIAVLLGVFREITEGRFRLQDPLHVRNRFESIVDGSPFQLPLEPGSDAEVYGNLGKSMTIRDLAYYMITTSSNLATNLLVQLVGTSAIRQALVELEISGVRVVRGVEDQKAYDEGLNNMVTANGLVSMLRAIVEKRAFSETACDEMLAILHDQKHRSGLPAGLPAEVRIAHKTGNISTVHHDAGVVFAEGRRPYVLAILTQFEAARGRGAAVADLASHVHAALGELHDHG